MSDNRIRILFVCTGNICRSPLAHAIYQKLVDETGRSEEFHVDSAGTDHWEVGKPADPRMRRVGARHGVTIEHRARQLARDDLSRSDLILVMDRTNLADARSLAADEHERSKIKLFREFDPKGSPTAEVPDPYYEGDDAFERVYEMVERTARNLLSSFDGSAARRGSGAART